MESQSGAEMQAWSSHQEAPLSALGECGDHCHDCEAAAVHTEADLAAAHGSGISGEECTFDEAEGIADVAEALGIDTGSEPYLIWLAKRAVFSRLPQPWVLLRSALSGRLYYFNVRSRECTRRHPALDDAIERVMLFRAPLLSPTYEPSPHDASAVRALADDFGILHHEDYLLWIAEQAYYGALPRPWLMAVCARRRRAFFCNCDTCEVTMRHPQAGRYCRDVIRARQRLGCLDMEQLLECSHDSRETPRDSKSEPYSPSVSYDVSTDDSSSCSTSDSSEEDSEEPRLVGSLALNGDLIGIPHYCRWVEGYLMDEDDTDVDESLPDDGIFDPRITYSDVEDAESEQGTSSNSVYTEATEAFSCDLRQPSSINFFPRALLGTVDEQNRSISNRFILPSSATAEGNAVLHGNQIISGVSLSFLETRIEAAINPIDHISTDEQRVLVADPSFSDASEIVGNHRHSLSSDEDSVNRLRPIFSPGYEARFRLGCFTDCSRHS